MRHNCNFKAIIFDMDGTLINSTYSDYLCWQKLFHDYGRELSYEEYVPLLGIKSAVVMEKRLGLTGEAVRTGLARKLNYFKELLEKKGIDTIPYAENFLSELRKEPALKIALATSSRRAKMEMVIRKTNLAVYFDAIVTGDDLINSKPSPDIYLLAAEKLQIRPQDCIAFEDAPNGVRAAKDAGMFCIAITTTHKKDSLAEADDLIDSFEGYSFEKVLDLLSQKSF